MVSKYFNYTNSFDELEDPLQVKDNINSYWHLYTQEYNFVSWNESLFTEKELERIKIIGRRIGISRSTTGGQGENCLEHRRSFNSWICQNNYTNWIYERLTELIIQNNNLYFNFDLTMIENLQFTYYNSSENGCYKGHIDPLDWKLPHNRKLSVIVQLSDPEDYEGGDILLYRSHEPCALKKKKGMVHMFPSYTLHEVTPVTKGERYSLVAWVHGPAFR